MRTNYNVPIVSLSIVSPGRGQLYCDESLFQ